MASFLSSVRQGFGRQSNKGNNGGTKSGNASPTIPSPSTFQPGGSSTGMTAPRVPPVAASPSLSSTMPGAEGYGHSTHDQSMLPPPANPTPLFMKDGMQIFIVKGNYMTLAARPKSVETGEWLAHHVVEQFRLLSQFITVIQSSFRKDGRTIVICNPSDCPTMSAGTHTYTWLDSNRVPTRLPACQYITLVQKWISGKILDPTLFPTDTASPTAAASTYPSSSPLNLASGASSSATGGTSTPPIALPPTTLPAASLTPQWIGQPSGFPEHFLRDCKNIYKQMFRVWAHLYWNHFENPFYHLDLERHFNSSFVHFVVVGTEFDLLSPKDLEPMQGLLEKWRLGGVFPSDSRIVSQASERERRESEQASRAGSVAQQGGGGGGGGGGSGLGLGLGVQDGQGSRQGSLSGGGGGGVPGQA